MTVERHDHHGESQRGEDRIPAMKPMAERSEREYLEPATGADELLPDRFPPALGRWTWIGLAAGAALGALIGWAA